MTRCNNVGNMGFLAKLVSLSPYFLMKIGHFWLLGDLLKRCNYIGNVGFLAKLVSL